MRLIAYDNERGKGDQRHHGDREESCAFTTIEALLEDVPKVVRTIREDVG